MKTIALAVDGMEPSLCRNWMEQGHLQNFCSQVEKGVSGTAECTNLSSAKQWTTHFTGLKPSDHGITGFTKEYKAQRGGDSKTSPKSKELIDISDIDYLTYPELLCEKGHTVGLINPLPIWPPLELPDSYCISGVVTPPKSEKWAYPSSLQDELEENGYQIDVRYGDRPYGFIDDGLISNDSVSFESLEEDIFQVLNSRIDTAKRLISSGDKDFEYVLVKSIDLLQHIFWAHLESEDEERFQDSILEAYMIVDEFIGWIENLEEEINLIIFSDHGFSARRTAPPEKLKLIRDKMAAHINIPPKVQHIIYELTTSSKKYETGDIDRLTGDHSNPAYWIMTGPSVKPGKNINIAFEDITPTILSLLDVPIPRQYTGSPITEGLLTEPKYEKVNLKTERNVRKEPRDKVSERLYNLGYAEMVDKNQ